jgi:hypothetical protein
MAAVGAVATVAGARGVLVGATETPGTTAVAANVDSEYRFYAAWYHVVGLVLLRAARSEEVDRAAVQLCAGGFGIAAAGRLLSLRKVGRPHPSQLALLVLEIVIAVGLPTWHRRSGRTA